MPLNFFPPFAMHLGVLKIRPPERMFSVFDSVTFIQTR